MEQRFQAAGCEIIIGCTEAWRALRRTSPKVVGIDTEGVQHVPPLLVQIAYRDASTGRTFVILEAPRDGRMSQELVDLLADSTVAKVFCDAASDTDALGTIVTNVQDIQSIAERDFEGSKKMGLGALGSKFVFEGGCKKNAKGWKFFAFLKERPLAPWPSLVRDAGLCRYAAADAWMTLAVFEQMQSKARPSLPTKPNYQPNRTNNQTEPLTTPNYQP